MQPQSSRRTVVFILMAVVGFALFFYWNREPLPDAVEALPKHMLVQRDLEIAYTTLCVNNGHLKLLKVYQTTEDSYVVEIEADNTFKHTSDTNSKERNLKITKAWSALVNTPEASRIAKNYNLFILSVRQYNNKGEMGSVAIIN